MNQAVNVRNLANAGGVTVVKPFHTVNYSLSCLSAGTSNKSQHAPGRTPLITWLTQVASHPRSH